LSVKQAEKFSWYYIMYEWPKMTSSITVLQALRWEK